MLDENDSTTTEAAPETTDSGPAPTPEGSTETSPAQTSPVAVVVLIRPVSTPICVAATRNGRLVAWSRPAAMVTIANG